MRRAVLLPAAAGLLIGPTVLAFYAGGYFDGPRLVATLVVWVLVLGAAFVSPRPLPSSGPGWAALGGLALITAWTGISLAWAPLGDPATGNLVRLLMYVGALVAAAALLRDARAARAVEPALVLGAVVVIGYGLAGRLLPGLIDVTTSWRAAGRLEQPITYWNAEGALAAMGLVLAARLAGDGSRSLRMRALAAAASAPLGLGVYLSYSRGAIAAAVIGLVVLLAAAPSRSQLRAAVLVLGVAILVGAISAPMPGVAELLGSLSARETQGAVMLGILVLVAVAAAVVQARLVGAEGSGRLASDSFPAARRVPLAAAIALAVALFGLGASGAAERSEAKREDVRGAARLTSVDSLRYDYWRVGVEGWKEHPLRGLGSGGFRVVWLRERPVNEHVSEVHSLPLEMLIELGVPGVLGFVLFLGGIGLSARRALRLGPMAAGPWAAVTVYFLHSAIDWDWQLPAVTLVALILAGALIAAGEASPGAPAPRARRARVPRRRPRAAAPA
jgi:hypothetical protein